ncbi:hypothetical protein JWG45_13120 [Leptospira sp. 201903070]|uniref:Uncharacterized protein n=1 Tax=Leptospira ainlahdjerensis TaxID=2810033 RepID=A0ABS2UCK0_9LEPT|nr:hypothetical protein [Leptospira ainlahdjerensis]MBM9578092.1 hypothetical protein [Leptospira ainlahdjerensis]
MGKAKRGKDTLVIVILDKNGIPIPTGLKSKLIQEANLRKKGEGKINDLFGDMPYDSDT